MKRRDFITLLGGAAAAWPLAALAEQDRGMRHIGVIIPAAADDPAYRARNAGFLQGLRDLGWTSGHNVQIEYRWSPTSEDRRRNAAELVGLGPDVILATGSQTLGPLRQVTRGVPIVFVGVVDPVGAGYVASLARPGGNVTGFTNFEYSLGAIWLELIKEMRQA